MTAGQLFFDPHQRATMAAAMARIIPADDTPGALEANTIRWLDRYLSGTGYVRALPDGSGFEVLSGREERVWAARIGRLREQYTAGVLELDRRSRERFGADFTELAPARQDAVLAEVERHARAGAPAARRSNQNTFDERTAPFFALLVVHTRQAFYSDPVYGGNQERVGWRVIGFDGPASLADVQAGRYSTDAYLAGPSPGRTVTE
jgi:gluconate 2-dehydrogenase gamma chain